MTDTLYVAEQRGPASPRSTRLRCTVVAGVRRMLLLGVAVAFGSVVVTGTRNENPQSLLDAEDTEEPYAALCDVCTYYQTNNGKDDDDFWTRANLQALLVGKTMVNYRGSFPNTWDALEDLDAYTYAFADADEDPATADVDAVRLIYTNTVIHNASQYRDRGNYQPGTWNREHVWPKSRGVGDDPNQPRHNDLHHLFPADPSTNSQARSNRFFGNCTGTGNSNSNSNCTAWKTNYKNVANQEYPDIRVDRTSQPSGIQIFEPPPHARGSVTRALLYMDLRYAPELELTDHPNNETNAKQMSYLSTLLAWHAEFPPTLQERARNHRICAKWQGNRNPFVDLPRLADVLHGGASLDANGLDLDLDCTTATTSSTSSPDLSSPPTPTPTTDLASGDVMIVGLHSQNPDVVALVALVELEAGRTIFVSDAYAYDDWKGFHWNPYEGRASLVLQEAIPAGTVFGYGEEGLPYNGNWTVESNFLLGTSGDFLVVYSSKEHGKDGNNDDDNHDDILLLSAVSYGGHSVSKELATAMPDGSVVLGTRENYVYTGVTQGTKESLHSGLVDAAQWKGSNDKTQLAQLPTNFRILLPGASASDTPLASSTSTRTRTGAVPSISVASAGGRNALAWGRHRLLLPLMGLFLGCYGWMA